MKAAADGIRPVSLELGGKNPGVVFADCDFEAAVAGIARASFLNTGQICLGTERVYVERPIFDKFVAALKDKAEAMRPGHPSDKATGIGPLISLAHRDKVLRYYKRAMEDGATLICGGGIPQDAGILGRRRLGTTDHLDGIGRELRGCARGDFWSLLSHSSVR